MSPSPENFRKIEFETIDFGAYLKQTFEIPGASTQGEWKQLLPS